MKALMKTTKSASPATVEKKWVLIDAEGLVVGRAASIIANILRGKHKPSFTPHVDCGDHVIVINADKVKFTGKKLGDKTYYKHTGYAGGIKEVTAHKVLEGRFPSAFLKRRRAHDPARPARPSADAQPRTSTPEPSIRMVAAQPGSRSTSLPATARTRWVHNVRYRQFALADLRV
jgi:ribosomal protein L13